MKAKSRRKHAKFLATIFCFVAACYMQCSCANNEEEIPLEQGIALSAGPNINSIDKSKKEFVDEVRVPLVITTESLPVGVKDVYYEVWLDYSHGDIVKPRWFCSGLPQGLYLDSYEGVIYGMPSEVGIFDVLLKATMKVKVTVIDEISGVSCEKMLSIEVQDIKERMDVLSDEEKKFYSYFAEIEGGEESLKSKKKFLGHLRRLEELRRDIERYGKDGVIDGVKLIINNLQKASYDEKILISDVLDCMEDYIYKSKKHKSKYAHQSGIVNIMRDFFDGGISFLKMKTRSYIKSGRSLNITLLAEKAFLLTSLKTISLQLGAVL